MQHHIYVIELCKINSPIFEFLEIENLGLKESIRFPLDSSKTLLHGRIGNL